MKRMAKEGRLHKRHRRDWPGFLRRVVPDRTWQEVHRRVNHATDPRVRWSCKCLILCRIMMGWSIQRQLTKRFREGYELLSCMFYRRRRCGGTYQGLRGIGQTCGTTWSTALGAMPKRHRGHMLPSFAEKAVGP